MENKKSECELIHEELNYLSRQFYYEYENSESSSIENVVNFKKLFKKLFEQSKIDNYYWDYCPVKVYVEVFEKRLIRFLRNNSDAVESDFYTIELKRIKSLRKKNISRSKIESYEGRYDIEPGDWLYSFVFELDFYKYPLWFMEGVLDRIILYSYKRKIEFLQEKISQYQTSKKVPSIEEDIPNDYSNNSDAEKIVFMDELGVIELLRKLPPFNTSILKLAEGISTFSGINSKTAQSYLNPMLSLKVKQKNNPRTPTKVNTVQDKLIKIGYIIK